MLIKSWVRSQSASALPTYSLMRSAGSDGNAVPGAISGPENKRTNIPIPSLEEFLVLKTNMY